MSNPLDDYFETKDIVKTAGLFGAAFKKGTQEAYGGKQLGQLAAHTLGVAGAGMLIGAARKAYMAAPKGKHHKEMMEVNPDLQEHQQADPAMFNRQYSSLRNLSPQFATDTIVAGSYMRQMALFPENAGNVLVKSIQEAPEAPGPGLKEYTSALNIAQKAAPPVPRDGGGQDQGFPGQ